MEKEGKCFSNGILTGILLIIIQVTAVWSTLMATYEEKDRKLSNQLHSNSSLNVR